MTVHGTVDPELLAAIETMPVFDFIGDLAASRKAIDDFMLGARAGFAHPDMIIEQRSVAGPAGAP